MGSLSQDAGAEWEKIIWSALRGLQGQLIVSWFEHQEPRWVKRPGQGFIRAGKTGADFSGHMTDLASAGVWWGGKAFGVEAKSVGEKEGRYELDLEDDVSERQVRHLEALARDTGLAFLAVQFRLEREPWVQAVIPWSCVPWRRAISHHKLSHEAARAFQIPERAVLFEHLLDRNRARDPR